MKSYFVPFNALIRTPFPDAIEVVLKEDYDKAQEVIAAQGPKGCDPDHVQEHHDGPDGRDRPKPEESK